MLSLVTALLNMIRIFMTLIVLTILLIHWLMGQLTLPVHKLGYPELEIEDLPWDQGVFFLEMSRTKRSLDLFTSCSVESTARENSDRTIFMLVDSENPHSISKPKYLTGLTNLEVRKFNFTSLLLKRLGLQLFSVLELSLKPMQTWSDLSRILLLNEVGGTYFDIDSISVRPIPTLFRNLLQTNVNSSLTNCFMIFQRRHAFLDIIFQGQLKKLRKQVLIFFDGPLVTKLAKIHCHSLLKDEDPANTYQCPKSWNLTIHSLDDPGVLHFLDKPIQYELWNKSNLAMFPHLFALHLSSVKNMFFDNPCALMQYRHLPKLMATYCPKTYTKLESHASFCQNITDYFPAIQEQFRGPLHYGF